MNQLRKVEKILKGCLKDRRRVTLALLVSFLINGGLSYASENIKVSSDQKNEIIIDKDENNNIHINIATPNENGVSHNKYEKFSIEKEEKVIFNNNNTHDREGATLDSEYKAVNEGLTGRDKKAADLIISEVDGSGKSVFEGKLEVYGNRADLIFANENGIDINGQEFINAGDVAFVTQKGLDSWDKNTLKNNDFSTNDKVNIEKGTITVGKEGIKVSEENKSNFKLIAEKIEVDGEIGKFGNKGNIELHSGKTKNISQENISGGIKLTGSMYGNNIVIRNYGGSNGIELAGSIEAKDQIDIDSKTGKIIIKEKIEAKKVNVTSAGGRENTSVTKNQNSPLLNIEDDGKIYGHEQVEITAKSVKDIQSKGQISAGNSFDEENNTNEKKVIFKFKDSGSLTTKEIPNGYILEDRNSNSRSKRDVNEENSSLKELLSTVEADDKIEVIFNYTNGDGEKYTLNKKADKGESEKSEKELEKERKEREEKEKKLKEEEEKKRKEAELKEKAEKEKREKEEAERKLKEQEELKKKQKEEAERIEKERKLKEEEERKAREKAEKDRKAREEAELKEKQLKEKEEAEKRAREEKERLQKEEEARRKAEQERLEKQKEEELAKKKAKEEKDKYDQLNSKNVVIDSSKGSKIALN